jgi:hypothetical protein
LLSGSPAFAKKRPNDASPEGRARIVTRIHDNAERIRRMTFVFQAPGFPRQDPVRAALIRDNADLMLRAEDASRTLLDPIRKEPPPGQWAYWQLLRDTESGAHAARLLDDYDFRDATIARRFAPTPAAAPPGVRAGGRSGRPDSAKDEGKQGA